MGQNHDLHRLLNAPREITCPYCHKKQEVVNWEDEDVEDQICDLSAGKAKPGQWEIGTFCHFCEKEFTVILCLKADLKYKKG